MPRLLQTLHILTTKAKRHFYEQDIMVLNNVTKFHKILIKTIRLRERMLLGVTRWDVVGCDLCTDRCAYVWMDRGNIECPGHCNGGGIKIVTSSKRSGFNPCPAEQEYVGTNKNYFSEK